MANFVLCCSSMTLVVLLLSLANRCGSVEGQGSSRGHKLPPTSASLDPSEVARQNRITQHILAQYLQRRLFPHLARPPSSFSASSSALDSPLRTRTRSTSEQDAQDEQDLASYDQDALDQELETVETEQISNVFDERRNFIEDECTNCVDDGPAINKWTMPLLKLGEKRYYLGIFFRANWYRAAQYCRYHGMHLASISSQEENDKLEKHIRDFGLGHEHFWTSGTDQAEEGTFFWMSTGRPITFTNWNTGEPNNFRYENGEEEHCLELWNRDGKGLKWNDSPCSFETYFVCEVGM
ncbi:mannose-binding protein C-like [Nilaparvata lugens]|uniref:mannose-binding protein C-like n=1 Tax=Nilaparvata lugens TaxID=108931 RepID=UPI00193D393C|nr:mannose-binding protein C-like [Nilaparvata lugens]